MFLKHKDLDPKTSKKKELANYASNAGPGWCEPLDRTLAVR